MADYLDPTYDLGFKLLFGRDNISNDVLTEFLNALFEYCGGMPKITSIQYKNNERQAEWKEGKGIRYDILCKTETNHNFIVEMQKAPQENFLKRAEYYVSRGLAEQGYKGKNCQDVEWDYALEPVIGVFICNFHLTELDHEVITRSRILDEDTFKPIGDLSRYIYIQLPFFEKGKNECDSLIDQWIYNLKNMGPMQEVAFKSRNEIFRRLEKISNVASLTPEERYSYDADVKNARDALNQMRYAYNEGEAKGRAEGRAEAIAEKIMEARRMGLSEDLIASLFGPQSNN